MGGRGEGGGGGCGAENVDMYRDLYEIVRWG